MVDDPHAAASNAKMPLTLEGVVPIIPTPFDAQEGIDFDALTGLVDFAHRQGLQAVCLPAYASEFYKLSDAERTSVTKVAIAAAQGKLKVVAQSNHPAAIVAADTAKRYEGLGADMISFALPRLFALKEDDLLCYSRVICQAVSLPVLIQDFNPGGPTVGGDFARRLADECGNFRYLKLEESQMGEKIRSIIAATQGRIGVLEGWGGMYMLDLIPAGICGLMPGLGVAGPLARVWHLAKKGQLAEALAIFQVLLPQIGYSLQSSELFPWVEKRLLNALGALSARGVHVRTATWKPDEATLRHADWLNEQVVALAKKG